MNVLPFNPQINIISSKVAVVYFVCLVPNRWEDLVREQLDQFKNLDLYLDADLFICASGTSEEFDVFSEIIRENYQRFRLLNWTAKNLFEYPGIKAVYDLAFLGYGFIMYFHSKGVWNQSSYSDDVRHAMFEWNIKNHKEIVRYFEENIDLDIVCPIPDSKSSVRSSFQ
jgi:hypothetical protein